MLLKPIFAPAPGPTLRTLPVDLDELAMAMESSGDPGSAWLDTRTGEINHRGQGGWRGEDEEEAEVAPDCIRIEPVATRISWGDMSDFIDELPEGKAKERLGETIHGKGVFRRFKDALYDFPAVSEAWFAFSSARQRERAVAWLADQGLKVP